MNVQSIDPAMLASPGSSASADHHQRRHGILSFLGHFLEMTLAMMAGMAVYGMLLDLPSDTAIEAGVLLMAGSMTVPMTVVMRLRGHPWRAAAEMVGAMVVPPAALFPLLWAGVISGGSVVELQHVLMLPSMLALMLVRRSEYGLAGGRVRRQLRAAGG